MKKILTLLCLLGQFSYASKVNGYDERYLIYRDSMEVALELGFEQLKEEKYVSARYFFNYIVRNLTKKESLSQKQQQIKKKAAGGLSQIQNSVKKIKNDFIETLANHPQNKSKAEKQAHDQKLSLYLEKMNIIHLDKFKGLEELFKTKKGRILLAKNSGDVLKTFEAFHKIDLCTSSVNPSN